MGRSRLFQRLLVPVKHAVGQWLGDGGTCVNDSEQRPWFGPGGWGVCGSLVSGSVVCSDRVGGFGELGGVWRLGVDADRGRTLLSTRISSYEHVMHKETHKGSSSCSPSSRISRKNDNAKMTFTLLSSR